jgi:hypothetical protein
VYVTSTKGIRISDSISWHPEKIKLPGSSKEEILFDVLQTISADLKNPAVSPGPTSEKLISDIDSLKSHFLKIVPAQEQRVVATPSNSTPPEPLIISTSLAPSTTPETPHPTDSRARAKKASARSEKILEDTYRPLTRTGASQHERIFFDYIGKSFTDTDDDLHFQVTKVVIPKSPSKSTTPLFQYFDTSKFPRAPVLEQQFEYTPCSEFIKRRKKNRNAIFSPDFIIWDEETPPAHLVNAVEETPAVTDEKHEHSFLFAENIQINSRTALFAKSASLDPFYSTAGEAHMATVYAQPIDLPVPNFPEAGKIPQRVSRHNFARAQAYSTFHSSQTSPLLNITPDGKQLTYRGVMRGEDQDLWGAASGAELIKLIVERKTLVPIHKHEQPADQRKYTTYYNPQVKEKLDDNGNKTQRVRGTFGGNKKCAYDGPTSSPVADITFVKIHWNSVVSDRRNHRNNSRYATVDITDFYLMSSLEQPEWINIPIKNIPLSLLEEHNLIQFISDEHILCRVDGTMYGHPVAGRLANADLVKHLAVHGYVQDANVPCMFAHVTAPISFSLVVDDFGIKYVHDSDLANLCSALREKYQIRVDLTGSKYIGVRLDWDYTSNTLVTSMPNYVSAGIARFCRDGPPKPAKTPGIYVPPTFGAPDLSATVDDSPLASAAEKQFIQEVVGYFLFYARMIDHLMLPSLTFISKKQSAPTQATLAATHHFLRYASSHTDFRAPIHASDMLLKVISDGSHLSQEKAGSIAGGIHYLGNKRDSHHIMNAPILAVCNSIPTVCSAASETEYASLFINAQHAYFERTILEAMGYKQPPTQIYADNTAAVGIANDTVKLRRSKAIDMRYHWIRDRVRQGIFQVTWSDGKGNVADYFTKIQPTKRHLIFESIFTKTQ